MMCASPSNTNETASKRKTLRVLNTPLLVTTLIAALVLGLAAYGWHSYQLKRVAKAFLHQAISAPVDWTVEEHPEIVARALAHKEPQLTEKDRLEVFDGLLEEMLNRKEAALAEAARKDLDWDRVASYLYRYSRLNLDDAVTRCRLATAYDFAAKDPRRKQRAVQLYYEALGMAPEEWTRRLRVRLAELLIEGGRFASAEDEAQRLLEATDQDPEGLRLKALALFGQLRDGTLAGRREASSNVVEALEQALLADANKGDIFVSQGLAGIYRNEQDLPGHTLSAMLAGIYQKEKEDESPGGGLAGIRDRILRADATPVESELAGVFERLDPQAAQASDSRLSSLLKVAYGGDEGLSRKDERDLVLEVRKLLADDVMDQMVAVNPENPEALLVRYGYRQSFRLPGAKEDLESALKHGPENLAVLAAAARSALVDAERRRAEGAALEEVNKHYQEARRYYERAIDVTPSGEDLYLALGDVFRAEGDTNGALESWQRGLRACDQDTPNPNTLLVEVVLNARLAEVFIQQGQPEKANEHVKAIDDVMAKLSPRLQKNARVALSRSNDLLRARLLLAERDLLPAVSLLQRLAVGQQGEGTVAAGGEVWGLLATAYATLGRWDQAASAYEELTKGSPGTESLHLMAGEAWANAGRPELAVEHYRQALTFQERPQTWFSLARAELQRQSRLPVHREGTEEETVPNQESRNWDAFVEALENAKNPKTGESLAEPWRLTVLEADYRILLASEKGQQEEGIRSAMQLLREAENQYPQSTSLLQALVLAYERLGAPAEADRALEKFDQLTRGSVESLLLRSGLYAARKQYEDARKALQKALAVNTLPATTRAGLQAQLVQLGIAEGRFDEAEKQLDELLKPRQKEEEKTLPDLDAIRLAAVGQVLESALDRRDLAVANRWEGKLRELEGLDGISWKYCKARRLLLEAKDSADPRFGQAQQLLADIETQRPTWPVSHLLKAQMFERQGKNGAALDAYQQAFRFGAKGTLVYQRLVELLYLTRRFEEAERYLAQARDQVPASRQLSRLAILVALAQGDRDRALEAARRHAERLPEDAVAHVWLAQMLLATDPQKAESEFQEAVKLAPTKVEPYDALFSFYLRAEQPEQAKQTLEELLQNVELVDLPGGLSVNVQRDLIAARAYQRLGDSEKAESHYGRAQKLAPESVIVQRNLAEFLTQSKPEEAEKAWRRVLQLDSGDSVARRNLAILLAQSGDEKDWQEAQQLLKQKGADDAASSANRRLLAIMLLQHGGDNDVKEAEDLFKELVADAATAVAMDRVLLARLYELEAGKNRAEAKLYEQDKEKYSEYKGSYDFYTSHLDQAREQYVALAARPDANPMHLALYADLLIRHGLHDEAGGWLAKLERLMPNDLNVMRLRARWLRAQDPDAQIEPEVEELAELLKGAGSGSLDDTQLALSVGNLYSSLDQLEAAERWYERLLDIEPERYEGLAMALARQDRRGEAIHLCRDAAESDSSPRPAMVMAAVLSSGVVGEEEAALAEPVLANAVKEHKDNAPLLFAVANARLVQQRADEALKLYQQVLELQPNNLWAMNNLAVLLAEMPDRHEEAQQYIDQAIKIGGQLENLLDTKGMTLIYAGKPDAAVGYLEKAATAAEPDPRYFLHLAFAYAQLGQADKASGALKQALDAKLADEVLTRREQELLIQHLVKLAPEEYGRLAALLGRLGRTTEAIRRCTEAADAGAGPEPAMVLASLLSAELPSPPTSEDFKLAEPLLSRAIQDSQADLRLLYAVGVVLIKQERNEEAVGLYKQILERKPTAGILIPTLNNLATILSEQPDTRKEAIQYIDQAIQIAGPAPELLDTKGTILLQEGKPDEAVKLLEQATSGVKPDPRIHFHLALAYDRSGNVDKARTALATAQDANLAGQILTRTEKKLLTELEQKLGG